VAAGVAVVAVVAAGPLAFSFSTSSALGLKKNRGLGGYFSEKPD
jgi:hypothetical protein